MRFVGRSARRNEDERLLRGGGRFVDDVDRSGQLWMRVVRAPSAHAKLLGVDTAAAREVPGVRAVVTAADLNPVPPIPLRLRPFDQPLDDFLQPVLAVERVRYVGEPVAAVVADDPYVAEDAAELVACELDALNVVLDARGGAAFTLRRGYGDVDEAFERAARVVDVEVEV